MRVDWGDQKHRGNDHACVQARTVPPLLLLLSIRSAHRFCASRDREIEDLVGRISKNAEFNNVL